MFKPYKPSREFLHNFISLPELDTVTIAGKRHYVTPAGDFPSVTTVLSEKMSKAGLEIWRAKVGEEQANRISTQASHRGTAIHTICENYLMNKDYRVGSMPVDLDTFSRIRPFLDKYLGSIYGIEVPLWSAKFKTAGRTDLLAGWDGMNSVIDFKTSKRVKTEDQIESYFIQATCYSMMAEALIDIKFPQIVIIMSVDDSETIVFRKNRDDYVDRVLEIFQ